MKKILTLTLLISVLSFGQKEVIITGEISNPKSDWVYLKSWDKSERMWSPIFHDSCKLDNGKFRLSTNIDSLTDLDFFDGNESTTFYVKPGEKLNLTLNTQYFDETINYTGDGANRNNAAVRSYLIEESSNQIRELHYLNFCLDESMDTTTYFNKLAEIDSSYLAFIDFELEQNQEMADFYSQKKKNSEIFTNMYVKKAYDFMVFHQMVKEEMGSQFLNAEAENLKGDKVQISDYYGKLTVLDFWATWCGPCKAEFPGLHDLEEKYEGQVTFLGVASFCKKEDWKKMAKEEGFHNSIFIEKEAMEPISKKYAIQTIPRYIILDSSGKIINLEAQRPSTGLEEELKELLK